MLKNYDLNLDKFFVKKDWSSIADLRDLISQPLSEIFYRRPGWFPLVNPFDSRQESCFKDYIVPTASCLINKGSYELVEKNLPLESYIDQIDQDIKNSIKQVYQTHTTVTLCYSGGIDSITILSYIISLGLLEKTFIICFENKTQNDPLSLHNNSYKKEMVTNLLAEIKSQCLGVKWMTITKADLGHTINNLGVNHVRCYATSKLLREHPGTVFIFGHHGNQILLHKTVFLDELLLSNQSAVDQITRLKEHDNYYTQAVLNYQIPTNPVGIEYTHMLMRPWTGLNGYNNSFIYSPIGSNMTFDLLRQLDFSTVSAETIADAYVARKLIEQNTSWLSKYITTESLNENDTYKDITFDRDELSPSVLTIPSTMTHDPIGLAYLNNQLGNKVLTMDVILALKTLHYLDFYFASIL